MCHVSHVIFHVSRVTFHLSHVMFHLSNVYIFFYTFIKQKVKKKGGANQWRVCYQRGLPCQVLKFTCHNWKSFTCSTAANIFTYKANFLSKWNSKWNLNLYEGLRKLKFRLIKTAGGQNIVLAKQLVAKMQTLQNCRWRKESQETKLVAKNKSVQNSW